MKQNKETLKSYFETGDKPTENQFVDLIDSYIDAKQPEGEANRRFVIDETGEVKVALEQEAPEYTLSPISRTNTVDLLKDGVSVSQIDLSPYLDDTNLARLVSGTVDANGLATFTRDDDSTFTVDLSNLKETQVQADFNQTDDTQPDYIKNKPTAPTLNDVLNEDDTSIESIHLTGTGDKFSINLDGEHGEAGLRLGSSAQVYRMVINQPNASLNQPTSLDFTTPNGITTQRILRLTRDQVITERILQANNNIVVNNFDPFVEIKDNQNEANSTVLKISNNTAERTITFPDASGTIALINNIPQLQAGSNITIDNTDPQNPVVNSPDSAIKKIVKTFTINDFNANDMYEVLPPMGLNIFSVVHKIVLDIDVTTPYNENAPDVMFELELAPHTLLYRSQFMNVNLANRSMRVDTPYNIDFSSDNFNKSVYLKHKFNATGGALIAKVILYYSMEEF